MASPYTTGPALIFVGLGSSNTPTFLGTCESAPQIEHTKAFVPVMNDLSGQVYSFDDMYEGEEGFIRCDLSRYNYPVYLALMDPTGPVLRGLQATPGLDVPGDIGSLMVSEGLCPQLWIQFPYNPIKQFMVAQGLPPGYHYLAVEVDRDAFEPGTKPLTPSINFHAKRVFNAPGTPAGSFLLYDFNMAGLPSIN